MSIWTRTKTQGEFNASKGVVVWISVMCVLLVFILVMYHIALPAANFDDIWSHILRVVTGTLLGFLILLYVGDLIAAARFARLCGFVRERSFNEDWTVLLPDGAMLLFEGTVDDGVLHYESTSEQTGDDGAVHSAVTRFSYVIRGSRLRVTVRFTQTVTTRHSDGWAEAVFEAAEERVAVPQSALRRLMPILASAPPATSA